MSSKKQAVKNPKPEGPESELAPITEEAQLPEAPVEQPTPIPSPEPEPPEAPDQPLTLESLNQDIQSLKL